MRLGVWVLRIMPVLSYYIAIVKERGVPQARTKALFINVKFEMK